jgi:hypothetical protein
VSSVTPIRTAMANSQMHTLTCQTSTIGTSTGDCNQ